MVQSQPGHAFVSSRALSRAALVCTLLALACLEPYAPPTMKNLDLLVVDGFLDSKNGLARVKLTRSVPLDSWSSYPVEIGATVEVESGQGSKFTLSELSPGNYEATRSDLTTGSTYRLIVNTRRGESYMSDFVTLRQSPALTDVSWVRDGDGITIRVDSEDPTGQTRYYQWAYVETWEYDSDRISTHVVKGGRPVYRRPDERIDICYSSQTSSKVLISTTSDQSGDVINDFPLVHIERGSRKLSRMYSIIVQQRALDETSYQYWLQLQRSNENLGGLFDPLPSKVIGNMHATQAGGPVALGYFNGGAVDEKRIFIRFKDLPEELQYVKRRSCSTDTVNVSRYPDGTPLTGEITMSLTSDPNLPWPICMDCRLDGGTTTKPSFWPR